MGSLLIWKQSRLHHSETRHIVQDLADLIDLVRTELPDRTLYMESRVGDGSARESRVRISPEDLTEEDFAWLTASVKNEVRGVRA